MKIAIVTLANWKKKTTMDFREMRKEFVYACVWGGILMEYGDGVGVLWG